MTDTPDAAEVLDQLGREKYIVLTTFRRNGAPVPTPIWLVRDGDRLAVWTPRDTGKVKRIRASRRVTVQACDVRGRTTHGPLVSGTAVIADEAETAIVRRLLARKYGLLGRLTLLGSRLRGGLSRTVGVLITLDA